MPLPTSGSHPRESVADISNLLQSIRARWDSDILNAEGKFTALPVAAGRGVKLGGTLATVDLPNFDRTVLSGLIASRQKFEDVVEEAEQAAVLVHVY